MIKRIWLAAALAWLSCGPAQALVVDPDGPLVTDAAAEVFIFAGALTATSRDGAATVTPTGALPGLQFIQLTTALGPMLQLQTSPGVVVMSAAASSLDFDGTSIFSATMDVDLDTFGVFGPAVLFTLELNDPFDPDTIYNGTGSLTVQDLKPEGVIPLPAALPLLLAGLSGLGALRLSRRR